jgi:hypothetical protein
MDEERRRTVLTASGVAVAFGLSGCLFGSSESKTTTSGGRSYDVQFANGIQKDDLPVEYDGATKATLSVEVDRVIDGENELLFEKSVELDLRGTHTAEDAFSTVPGERYGVNATLKQPYVDLGPGDPPSGFVFETGGEDASPEGRILAEIYNDRPTATDPDPQVRIGAVDPRR